MSDELPQHVCIPQTKEIHTNGKVTRIVVHCKGCGREF